MLADALRAESCRHEVCSPTEVQIGQQDSRELTGAVFHEWLFEGAHL